MELPSGYHAVNKNLVCKLNNKFLYGLGHASQQWFCKMSSTLLNRGFLQSKNEYSLFQYGTDASLVVLLVSTDDIILAYLNSKCVVQVQIRSS